MEVWKTGVTYQMFHALGLIAIGMIGRNISPSALLSSSGWFMLAGIILFQEAYTCLVHPV
ncbi:DUF423 domain-containing protein [Bacillus sp. N9]